MACQSPISADTYRLVRTDGGDVFTDEEGKLYLQHIESMWYFQKNIDSIFVGESLTVVFYNGKHI